MASGESSKATIEADLCSEFEKFGGNTTIESDALYDWIEETYPDLDEGKASYSHRRLRPDTYMSLKRHDRVIGRWC